LGFCPYQTVNDWKKEVMKRILTVVSAVLMVVSFAACGGASGGEVQKPSNVSADNPNVPENSNDSNNETKNI